MNVLDLFSGIGGFSLGLERAGMRTVAFCEIEPFCRRVLAKHWPHVPCYDDVRSLTAARLSADGVGPVHVICGGFPCQDLSTAGRRAGINGLRSGLWREYRRLIGDLRPHYVIVENVPGLLTSGMDRVLGDLAGLGYDAEWRCHGLSSIGAAHERLRVFIIAYPPSIGQPQPRLDWTLSGNRPADSHWETTDALDAIRRGAVPALCWDNDGLPAWMGQLACTAYGNSVSPVIPEAIGRAILAAEGR